MALVREGDLAVADAALQVQCLAGGVACVLARGVAVIGTSVSGGSLGDRGGGG